MTPLLSGSQFSGLAIKSPGCRASASSSPKAASQRTVQSKAASQSLIRIPSDTVRQHWHPTSQFLTQFGRPPPALMESRHLPRPSKAAQQIVAAAKAQQATCPHNLTWQHGAVSRSAKESLLKQHGCIIWFTGLSGSGKSTVAIALEHALASAGRLTALLDGDNIRHGLNCNLGFSAPDRQENIRRIGEVAKLMMESGLLTLTSFISPYERDRQAVRARIPPGDFIEVHMNVPLEVCEARDPKGLYKLAREGRIACFTGVDDPYEAPSSPEIVLEYSRPDGSPNTPDDMAASILDYLEQHGILKEPLSCSVNRV